MPVAMEGLEVLDHLASSGYKLGVVTNGKKKTQKAKMNALSILSKFDAVSISEVVGSKKPEGTIFQDCISKLGISKTEAIFVGDHIVNDYIGAMNFGLKPIWFQGSQSWPKDITPLNSIINLNELCGLVERI